MALRQAEIVGAQMLSPSVRLLELRAIDGAPIGHVAGQWVNLDVPVGTPEPTSVLRRAYSIASAPRTRAQERFELAVTRVQDGAASMALHELSVGATLAFDGPHGFFTREQAHDEPALFVGTGTGICPLRAMLQVELARPSGPKVALLFGCRTEADVLFAHELRRWASEHERFALHVTLSRPSDRWTGRSGYVQRHVRELAEGMGKPIVYACGLTRMVSDVRRVLKDELGYDRKRIRSERYD